MIDDEREPRRDPVIRLEIYGIVVLAFAVALVLALLSFDGSDVGMGARGRMGRTHNWLGPVGAHTANIVLSAIGGVAAFTVAGTFGWLGLSYLIGRRARMLKLDVLGALAGILALTVLSHMVVGPGRVLDHAPGGAVGAWVGEISASLVSTAGTVLVFSVVGLVAIVLLSRKSIFEIGGMVGRVARWTAASVKRGLRHGDPDATEGDADKTVRAPAEAKGRRPKGAEPEEAEQADPARPAAEASERAKRRGKRVAAEPVVVKAPAEAAGPEQGANADDEADVEEESELDDEEVVEDAESEGEEEEEASEEEDELDEGDEEEVEGDDGDEDDAEDGEDGADDDGVGVKIVESAAMRRARDLIPDSLNAEQLALPAVDEDEVEPFVLPSLSMLEYKPPETQAYDREFLKRNAQILEAKLLDYKVKGKVVEIHPGPVITMYEFMPAPGIKISSIANLADDLAMALSALRIRIVAPIPGKNVVGIEVPNAARETVYLKEILSDGSYAKARSKLTLALGKDIVGNPTCMNLAKAPHVLVAGATGSGKSVGINSFIVSLLYKAEPADVRMIMVDPKMLELSIYEGIPHLLLPVVTDPKQAATALKWAVKEMERRYRVMADMGVRNLEGYNDKVLALLADPGQRLPEKLRLARLKREARGEIDPKDQVLDSDGKPLGKLPFIVVVIDELADLMMVASKEVEHCIARLAQMARAAGIHLVVATQRPSVDVITGLIKANFPTRISFQVASKIDSRTILDRMGAEALLGAGDMLYMPPGASNLQRVHGCYVSEDEVHRIVAHLRSQGAPDYDMGILVSDEDEDGKKGEELESTGDDLYDQALRIAAEARYISTSFLQRKLKIGYNRAARIIEQMEENGIVGPSDGTSRPREVFIDPI